MRPFRVFLVLYFLTTSNLFSQQFKYWRFEEDEQILVHKGKIRSCPEKNCSSIFNIEDAIEYKYDSSNKWYEIILNDAVVLDPKIQNNYLHINLNRRDTTIQGWIHIAMVEKKSLPNDIETKYDTTYYLSLLENIEWKQYKDTLRYSKRIHAMLYQLLANAYLRKELYYKAVVNYTKSIKYKKEYYSFAQRATAKMQMRDYYGAIEDFSFILSKNTDNYLFQPIRQNGLDGYYLNEITLKKYMFLGNRGICYYNLEKFNLALKDFNNSILNENSENNSISYFYRGLCKLNLNDKSGGCRDLSKSSEFGIEEAVNYIVDYCK